MYATKGHSGTRQRYRVVLPAPLPSSKSHSWRDVYDLGRQLAHLRHGEKKNMAQERPGHSCVIDMRVIECQIVPFCPAQNESYIFVLFYFDDGAALRNRTRIVTIIASFTHCHEHVDRTRFIPSYAMFTFSAKTYFKYRGETRIGRDSCVIVRLGIVSNQRVEGRSTSGSGPIAELATSDCDDVSRRKGRMFVGIDYFRWQPSLSAEQRGPKQAVNGPLAAPPVRICPTPAARKTAILPHSRRLMSQLPSRPC
ncbi:hypothetical protein ISCGN_014987 [Ixodes scapularis]